MTGQSRQASASIMSQFLPKLSAQVDELFSKQTLYGVCQFKRFSRNLFEEIASLPCKQSVERETAHARPPLDRCCGSYTPQFPERPFPASFPPRHGMALTVRGASAWVVRWLLACLSHTLQGAYCCHCDCIE